MNRRNEPRSKEEPVLLTVEEFANRLSVGRATARRIAGEAQAIIAIGRCKRVDYDRALTFIRNNCGE